MRTVDADVAVVGSGICALLVARALLADGGRVVAVERGAMKTHAEQLEDGRHETDVAGARHNHETAPDTAAYPWSYVYGVGGASLHWSGATPRLHESDLRMRSAYGVMEDWPIAYSELERHYPRAELALGVAGAPGAGEGRDRRQPPHPFSPMDDLVRPLLEPYVPQAQARPSRSLGSRPACCGSAVCELCPVDSRFSALNGLGDVLEHPRFELFQQTVAARVRLDPGRRRAEGLVCLDARGEELEVRAPRTVVAAGGFENAALMLRSGLDRPATGGYLFDHAHRTLHLHLRRPAGAAQGSSISTGTSHAFRDGDFRRERSAAIVSPFNPGAGLGDALVEGLMSGRSGKALRKEAIDRFNQTLPLDALVEDVPRADRRLTLSATKDSFGLPLNRISYGPAGEYEQRGWEAVSHELQRRLGPLGIVSADQREGPRGGHLLGTCRMGTGDNAVVDADLRHLDVENVWVAGASAFPTYSPVEPTLTIAALAIRLGDHLVGLSG